MSSIARKRSITGTHRGKSFQTKYFVRKNDNNDVLPVCQKAFLGILQVKRARVEFVTKQFFHTGNVPTEKRGGDHCSQKFLAKKESVMKFVSSLTCSELHYCHSPRGRKYLPSQLNITLLHRMYNEQTDVELQVKESYFRYIFNTQFNIGFGSPRVDMCSACIEFKEHLKLEKNPEVRLQIEMQKQIHKKRAKAFYSLLQEKPEETVTLSFDCQKNLPLPQIPDQEAYYRRQIYLYNFSVVVGSSDDKLNTCNCTSYVWTENVHKKGSNEISSCLFHSLKKLNLEGIKKIRLFADGCGGQNKNKTLLAMVSNWLLQTLSCVQEVEIFFPIRGHSFIPPDRLFGLCAKDISKRQVIENPEEYLKIIAKHSTIVKVGTEDCEIFDWKSEAEKILKPLNAWHFKFAPCKRYRLKRPTNNKRNILVSGENFYLHDIGSFKCITKKDTHVAQMVPKLIQPLQQNLVNPKKTADVKRLLEIHFSENWRQNVKLDFYKTLIDNVHPSDLPNEADHNECACELMEESPELCV